MLKVVFFGTSDYCLPVLEALKKDFDLQLVVTRIDKPVGRKAVLTPSASKKWADEHNIETMQPETLKKGTQDRETLLAKLQEIQPDLAIVADYGLIIPEEIFAKSTMGTFNIHFSKLPDLRGPSPVQFTLLRGDKEAWVTIFKLDNSADLPIKMDSGPIIWQQNYPIVAIDTTQTLYMRLFESVSKELKGIFSQPLVFTTQDHTKATFTRFLTRDDGFVDYKNLEKVENFNRFQAMTPWPGLWTIHPNGKRMKILEARIEEGKFIPKEIQFEGELPRAT